MKRGEIYWADLCPRSGSEQRGRRPVLVASHDAFNQDTIVEVCHRYPAFDLRCSGPPWSDRSRIASRLRGA